VDYSRVDERTGKPKQNSPRRALKKRETITDPFTKKQVVIQNIIGVKFENDERGNPKEVPDIERPNFPRTGALTLNFNHQGTYAFFERHPRNRDNPFRDKSKTPVFYRVNPKKRAIEEMEKHYLLSDAMEWVKNADFNELKSIWHNLDPTSQKNIGTSEFEILRRDMFRFAQTHPELLLKASNNKSAKFRMQIMDAEYFNIITFFDTDEMGINNQRQWVFVGKSDDIICNLELTENKYDGLIAFFEKKEVDGKGELVIKNGKQIRSKESVNAYTRLVDELKKILNPGAIKVTPKPQPIEAEVGSDEKGNPMKVKIAAVE